MSRAKPNGGLTTRRPAAPSRPGAGVIHGDVEPERLGGCEREDLAAKGVRGDRRFDREPDDDNAGREPLQRPADRAGGGGELVRCLERRVDEDQPAALLWRQQRVQPRIAVGLDHAGAAERRQRGGQRLELLRMLLDRTTRRSCSRSLSGAAIGGEPEDSVPRSHAAHEREIETAASRFRLRGLGCAGRSQERHPRRARLRRPPSS